jgi:hypothetical protein
MVVNIDDIAFLKAAGFGHGASPERLLIGDMDLNWAIVWSSGSFLNSRPTAGKLRTLPYSLYPGQGQYGWSRSNAVPGWHPVTGKLIDLKASAGGWRNVERIVLNTHTHLETLWQAAMASDPRRLLDMIETLFQKAIDARAPMQRPPGKAGLRAEKGYYRLLYLEGVFQDTITPREAAGVAPSPLSWQKMLEIVSQLKDLPELRTELLEGIESALQHIVVDIN